MTDSAITIRSATTTDDAEIRRLAYRDSASIPAHPMLLASQGDRLLAALSLTGDAVIADPFVPTAPAVELLRVRARHLRSERTGADRGFGRLISAIRRRAHSRGSLAGSPPGAGGRLLDLSTEHRTLTHPR